VVADKQDVLYDLILETICETVQHAVDSGKGSEAGGWLAVEKIIDRNWDRDFVRLFGPSLAAHLWRTRSVKPEQDRLRRAFSSVSDLPTPPVPVPTPPSPEPPAVGQAASWLSPIKSMPEPQPASGEGHGRESAVSILSKDIERLLKTPITVAGLWTTVGELHRKDILQLGQEKRERARNHLLNMRRERQALERVTHYFRGDQETLRGVVTSGRLSQTELRAAFGNTR